MANCYWILLIDKYVISVIDPNLELITICHLEFIVKMLCKYYVSSISFIDLEFAWQ